MEDALRESQDRYRNVVETQTELICRYLPDTTLTFVNDAYCRYFDQTRDQLIGTKLVELIPHAARPRVLEHIEMLCKYPETKTSEHEHEVTTPDGSVGCHAGLTICWLIWTAGWLKCGIGRDISDRKQAEEELKKAFAEVHD